MEAINRSNLMAAVANHDCGEVLVVLGVASKRTVDVPITKDKREMSACWKTNDGGEIDWPHQC